jgi:hypothetical protein
MARKLFEPATFFSFLFFARITAFCQQCPRFLSMLALEGERHIRVDAERNRALLAVAQILKSPPARPGWIDEQPKLVGR